jgi:hypothetical protein
MEKSPEDLLLDALAELEHEQWISWVKTLIDQKLVSEETKNKWEKLFVPYSSLCDEDQEKDKVWARKVVNKIRELMEEIYSEENL